MRHDQNGVVARKRPEHVGQLGRIDRGGYTRGRSRLRLDEHEVVGAAHSAHKLRDHTLQMQVLGKNVDALGKLAQAHVGDITRDRGLRALEAERA